MSTEELLKPRYKCLSLYPNSTWEVGEIVKNGKWPKLGELYRFLFNKDFEGAHDAMFDVIALKECFFEMAKRGVIVL